MVEQRIPVILHDETTHFFNITGDSCYLESLLKEPRYRSRKFLASWIVFDIMEINANALRALLGLVGIEYFLEFIQTQPDFQMRALLTSLNQSKEDVLEALIAIGVPFTQKHADQLMNLGKTLDGSRFAVSRFKRQMLPLGLNFSKLKE